MCVFQRTFYDYGKLLKIWTKRGWLLMGMSCITWYLIPDLRIISRLMHYIQKYVSVVVFPLWDSSDDDSDGTVLNEKVFVKENSETEQENAPASPVALIRSGNKVPYFLFPTLGPYLYYIIKSKFQNDWGVRTTKSTTHFKKSSHHVNRFLSYTKFVSLTTISKFKCGIKNFGYKFISLSATLFVKPNKILSILARIICLNWMLKTIWNIYAYCVNVKMFVL